MNHLAVEPVPNRLPDAPGTIVIALGGNAVAPPDERPTIANQFRHTRDSLAPIVTLAQLGWRIAIVHGNGPQVGDELLRNEIASDHVVPLPLGVLVAATAGWMGYMIQQSLQNALRRAGVERGVVTLITQSLCDAPDANLERPTKPIGHPLDAAERVRLEQCGQPVGRDGAGRIRRLIPSPQPKGVVEHRLVQQLVQGGHIVVACGGGGPPVYDDPSLLLEGMDAVVDKDRVAAVLGRELHADVLLILTDVEAVYLGYGTASARPVRRLTVPQAEELLSSRELGEGSMGPKVAAAVQFVRAGGQRAVITELSRGREGLDGLTGTTIVGRP